MPNINAPFGLRPVTLLSGQPYSQGVYNRLAAGGTVWMGDPVILGSDGNIVPQASAGAGTFVGVAMSNALTGADRPVFVADQHDLLMEVQSAGSGAGVTATRVGLNANLTPTSGDTLREQSRVTLDGATAAATANLDVHIRSLSGDLVNNEFGDFARVAVFFSVGRHRNTAGIGVA